MLENIIKNILTESKKASTVKGKKALLISTEGEISDLDNDLKDAKIKPLKFNNGGRWDTGYYIDINDMPKFLQHTIKVAGKDVAEMEYEYFIDEYPNAKVKGMEKYDKLFGKK